MNGRRAAAVVFLFVILAVLLLPSFTTGTVTIKATDSGEKFGESLYLRLKGLELHRAGEGETTGWISIVNQTDRYDLVSLSNFTETIVKSRVPSGRYDKVRFEVSEATMTVNGTETRIGVRAEKIMILVEFPVTSGETVFVIDFRTNFKQTFTQRAYRASPVAYIPV